MTALSPRRLVLKRLLRHSLARVSLVFLALLLLLSLAAPLIAQLRGIDPQRETRVTELAKNMSTGQLADLLTPVTVRQAPVDDPQGAPQMVEKPGIILGRELAARLGVFTGDIIKIFRHDFNFGADIKRLAALC